MNVFLTAEKAKRQARTLADFLSSIRRGISYSNALEAVARMYGAKEWNVLAARLESVNQAEAAQALDPLGFDGKLQQLMLKSGGQPQHARVFGAIRSDDDAEGASFDVAHWLLTAPASDIVRLGEESWCTNYQVAPFMQEFGDAGVGRVLGYVKEWNEQNTSSREPLGWHVDISERDALKFCRAFRYPVFVELMLTRQFGNLNAAAMAGYEVFVDNDQPGYFVWCLAGEGSDVSYESSDLAYTKLGEELEPQLAEWGLAADILAVEPRSGFLGLKPGDQAGPVKVPGRVDTIGGTGEVLVLKPGQPHLTRAQLREITDTGRMPLIQVAVSIDFEQLLDWDIEALNDEASERITGSIADLESIAYERYIPDNEAELHNVKQSVFILVTANWAPMDGMYDEGEEGYDEDDTPNPQGV